MTKLLSIKDLLPDDFRRCVEPSGMAHDGCDMVGYFPHSARDSLARRDCLLFLFLDRPKGPL
jgi:hypothetical protein